MDITEREQAQDELQQKLADEKYQLAVEASPGGMVMIDAAGSIVLVNAETERMFGYARAELIGQSVDVLVPADFRHHHAGHRSGFAAAPEARRMGLGRDLHGLRKDGSEFPVEIGLNPIRTRRGLFVLSVVVDITERKRAEAAAQEYVARERLYPAAIIASSNDVIITKELDGRISGWNPAAERLYGFTAQEAIGSSIDIIVPDAQRSEERLILERIRKGDRVDHYETKRKGKDGRLIDVSLSISPIKLPSGEVIGAAKIGRDITESKRAKQDLLESEQMAVGIIANALDAFIQLDQAGVVIEWNPQAEGHLRVVAAGGDREAGGRSVSAGNLRAALLANGRAIAAGRQACDRRALRGRGTPQERPEGDGRSVHDRHPAAGQLHIQRVRAGPDGQAGRRRAAPAVAEDRGCRPAHRRHRPRLQQYSDGHHQQHRFFG
jgi:PAS domain S-box-containing protein